MNPRALRISAYTMSSAAGQGRAATLAALRNRATGLKPNDLGPHVLFEYGALWLWLAC